MTPSPRCRIGINMDAGISDAGLSQHRMSAGYVRSIREAGALPVLVPAGADDDELRDMIGDVAAFVFSGGADYPPDFFGDPPHPETKPMRPERADTDRRLARIVLEETRLPVLGICGGLQLLQIALGGALIQHVEGHREPPPGIHGRHPIRITPGTRLHALLGRDAAEVNSIHHQAADPGRLGAGLRATAWAEDGTIEALEGADPERFLLGVQWHPEIIADADHRQRLFRGLLAAAAR